MAAGFHGAPTGADIGRYLHEHEEALRLVADALPAFVAFVDGSGRYAFVNRVYQLETGVSPEEMRGQHLRTILGPAAYERVRPYVEAALSGQRVEYEEEVPYRHGGTRRVRATYVPRTAADGRTVGFVSFVVDVTKRAHAVERTRTRVHEQAREIRTLRAQLAARDRLEEQQRTLYELSRELSRSAAPEDVAQVAVTRARTAVGACAAAVFAVTEGDAEAHLVASDGKPEIGGPWTRLPLDAPFVVPAVMRTREAVWIRDRATLLASYPHFAGTGPNPPREIHAVAALPLCPGDKAVGAVCFAFARPQRFGSKERAFLETVADLCAHAFARARILEAERQACERAERASAQLVRMGEVRERLLGVLGHDLGTPLTAISLSAERLQRKAFGDPRAAVTLAQILKTTNRMRRMIDQLLDFARIRNGGGPPLERRPIDLGALVHEIVGELRAAHPYRTLQCEARGDCRGEWDADRLAAVIANLVSNAIRHGAEAPVEVLVEDRGPEIALVVKNQGAPIPEDAIPFVFEPFCRGPSQPEKEGLGLGLYITREAVAAHGGEIEVTSDEAATTFTVRLPRKAPDAGVRSTSQRSC